MGHLDVLNDKIGMFWSACSSVLSAGGLGIVGDPERFHGKYKY